MPVRGLIPAGSSVEISFRAPADNAGAALVGSGWIGGPEPEVQDTPLAPAGSGTHTHRDRGARALRIHIDVPDGGGRVELLVAADGALVDSGTADADQLWTYIVE